MSAKEQANLIPYPPGKNGHTGYNLTERLRHALDKPLKEPGENGPVGERLVYSSLVGALKREPTPFKEVWDRAEGRVGTDDTAYHDNRVINIIVSSDRTKELTEMVGQRLMVGREKGKGY